jgi:hypothetical protein
VAGGFRTLAGKRMGGALGADFVWENEISANPTQTWIASMMEMQLRKTMKTLKIDR